VTSSPGSGLPAAPGDERWVVVRESVDGWAPSWHDTLFTLGTAGIASRGTREGEVPTGGQPALLAAGVYAGAGEEERLVAGPGWTGLGPVPRTSRDERRLDLRTGLLFRRAVLEDGSRLRSVRFASLVRPGVHAMRVETNAPLEPCDASGAEDAWHEAGGASGGIGRLVAEQRTSDGDVVTLERLAAVTARRRGAARRQDASRRLSRAQRVGFDAMLELDRRAWARRWATTCVDIPGDPEVELGLRFALFQLWMFAGDQPELAVGARGVSGDGYRGHVFWDADVHVLPALLTLSPSAARAMVGYRVARLDAAIAHARAHGHQGARFPWESARTGDDVTPRSGSIGAQIVPILTGAHEEHVTADVAWAVVRAAAWGGRDLRLHHGERRLLRETARYWASRCEPGPSACHLRGVIGPDEYHMNVDDNAYTNVMARWNLLTAAACPDPAVEDGERAAWVAAAASLVDGYSPALGRHEQFAGFFDLDPVLAEDVARPPFAADVLLGPDVARTQLVKQPDVLMLHHLVPELMPPASLSGDLAHYVPRTTHGSTLSPAITAAVLARAGHTQSAVDLLRTALRIDLDDIGGTTAAGIHLGACGAAWQALLQGFLGVEVAEATLRLDPRVPDSWDGAQVRFCCLDARVVVTLRGADVEVSTNRPVRVRLGQGQAVTVTPQSTTLLSGVDGPRVDATGGSRTRRTDG
jgi:trehalose/maltose hydrolase-like predicted phosphorylase